MSAIELREEINRYLNQVDEGFLKVVHSMLDTYVREKDDPIIGYEIDGTAVRASEARRQFIADIEAAKRGEYITLEDLEKESETW
jgi:hypothetical protein